MAVAVTHGRDITEITSAKELPQLQLTPSEIAAIKLTYLELISKVSVNELTGVEENALDRVTKKAYNIDPQLTKMFFGVEATREFDVDARTGLRKKRNEDSLRDDLAFIDASLKSATQRLQTAPPKSTPAAAARVEPESPPQSAPSSAAAKSSPKKSIQRPPSRPRRQQPNSIAQRLGQGASSIAQLLKPAQKDVEQVPRAEAAVPLLRMDAEPPAALPRSVHPLGEGVVSL